MAIDRRNINALMYAAYLAQSGQKSKGFLRGGIDNGFTQRANNVLGTDVLDTYGTDALNNLLYGGAVVNALATPIRCQLNANAKIGTINSFFSNANDTTPLEIVAITCLFSTAAGSTSTGYVSKEIQGQAAPGSTCMTGTFNLNATANTLQTATLAGVRGTPALILNPGEQLTFNISAVASLVGLYVTVWVRPHTGVSIAQYWRAANADIVSGSECFNLNIIPGKTIRAIAIRWKTAGSDAGAVTADVFKDASGTAPGGGSSVLAAAQSVKGTANVTVFPALNTTAGRLITAVGDRLTLKMTGTLTALAGLTVTVFFASGPDSHIVIPVSLWDAPSTDRTVFVADDFYIVSDAWEVWSTVSTSLTHLLTKDTGTTAPGAGTGLQTDNTNAGILSSGTVNVAVGSLLLSAVSTKPTLWLAPGDRLGFKNAGTAASVAGVNAAILLRKP